MWQWHCHHQPTVNTNGITWYPGVLQFDDTGSPTGYSTSTTQTITLTSHFATTTFNSVTETTLNTNGYFNWSPEESQGYQAQETVSNDNTPFNAALHVISTYDNGFQPTSSEYSSTNGKSKAILVSSSGDNDVFALYNVQVGPSINSPGWNDSKCLSEAVGCFYDPNNQIVIPSQHLFNTIDSGIQFNNVAFQTTSIDVYLHDLNNANSYSLYLDGTIVAHIGTPPSYGFYKATVNVGNAGSHSICVEITGDMTCGPDGSLKSSGGGNENGPKKSSASTINNFLSFLQYYSLF